MKKELVKIGKQIAYLLRHNNEDLKMDNQGWVSVDALLHKLDTSKEVLDKIVSLDNKQRYAYDDKGTKIRASQGHSLEFVNIDFAEGIPQKILFHGTKKENIKNIYLNGLKKMSRKYIHLSKDRMTAISVGQRHSKNEAPIILIIEAEKMYQDGYKFYVSENNVWLSEFIPPKYIRF